MPYVVSKDKLVPKTIDNKDVIGKDMLEFVKVKYMIYISILDLNSIIKLGFNLITVMFGLCSMDYIGSVFEFQFCSQKHCIVILECHQTSTCTVFLAP